jgi:RimJ/RimL family protein N-acetyltransferase
LPWPSCERFERGTLVVAMRDRRIRVEWPSARAGADEVLVAIEPTEDEVRAAAGELALAYNEPHNRAMIANTTDFTAEDVATHFATMRAEGARPFLLHRDGVLMGDADLRHVERGHAEFALLIAKRASQGKGLGTRFASMLHAFAFRALGLERMYVTIVPQNVASLRVFAKLGYVEDTSDEARAFTDDARDVSMSLAREDFERAFGEATRGVRYEPRRLGGPSLRSG